MGYRFGTKVYDIDKLKAYYERVANKSIGDLTPSQLLDKIMPKAGHVIDGKYFIVQNIEYWEDDNPEYEWERLMERYFNIPWSVDTSNDEARIEWKTDGFNADEFASEELGIEELPEED